jgi:hypothetical protein
MDTLQFQIIKKDTMIVLRENNIQSITCPDKSKTSNINNKNWIDLTIGISWPVVTIIIVILLLKPLKNILLNIAIKIPDLINFNNGQWGFIFTDSIDTEKIKTKQAEQSKEIQEEINAEQKEFFINNTIKDKAELKILKTLWTYQLVYDSKSFEKRWTFTLGVKNPEFDIFMKSMRLLANIGLVVQESKTQQFYLSDYGIYYCKFNENYLGNDIFKFN